MELLKPLFLWGLLGLSIPILIHLWNGRQGKPILWAATHWLSEKENQPVRGLRIDQWLILLLRMLLFVLLVLLLAQVFVAALEKEQESKVIHLVQTNQNLAADFRFELQQAIEKGEEIHWLDSELTRVESLSPATEFLVQTQPDLQKAIDDLDLEGNELRLYLNNPANLLKTGFYTSQVKPNLFLGKFEGDKREEQYIQVGDNKILTINDEGLFISQEKIAQNRGESSSFRESYPAYFSDYADEEQQYMQAALQAISEVYGLDFPIANTLADATLVFEKGLPKENSPKKIYLFLDPLAFPTYPNVVVLPIGFGTGNSSSLAKGGLPEAILEGLLEKIGFEKMDVPMSASQISSRFIVQENANQNKKANVGLLLMALFLLVLMTERYLSLKKGI